MVFSIDPSQASSRYSYCVCPSSKPSSKSHPTFVRTFHSAIKQMLNAFKQKIKEGTKPEDLKKFLAKDQVQSDINDLVLEKTLNSLPKHIYSDTRELLLFSFNLYFGNKHRDINFKEASLGWKTFFRFLTEDMEIISVTQCLDISKFLRKSWKKYYRKLKYWEKSATPYCTNADCLRGKQQQNIPHLFFTCPLTEQTVKRAIVQINHDIIIASKGRASAVNLWIPISNESDDLKRQFPGLQKAFYWWMLGSVPRAIYQLADTIAKYNTTHFWAYAKNLIDDLSERIITIQKNILHIRRKCNSIYLRFLHEHNKNQQQIDHDEKERRE